MKTASQDNYLCNTLCIDVKIENILTTFCLADEETDINMQIEESTQDGKLEMKGFTLGQSSRR